jgi:hypothetical protein
MTTASGYTLLDLSPNTLADKYFSWQSTVANGHGNWVLENPTSTTMESGTGYAVRAPQTYSPDPLVKATYTATFIGTTTNGDVNVPIVIGTDANIGNTYGDTTVGADDDQWHLIGNPYPSAIDIVSFMNSPTNASLLDGTVYLWTHNSPPSSTYTDPFYADYQANYTGSDYATVNSLGATNTASSGGVTPSRYIASGQSFFIMGTNNGTAVFENTMRVKNDNGVFLRTTEEETSTNNDFEKHRIWLNLSDDNEGFSQILVGYADGATLEWDRGLDGLANGGNFVSFYSINQDNNLAIQGRPLPFDEADVVKLGYNATTRNIFRSGLDHLDGLFLEQNVYLRDNDLNSIHDLKASPYLFNSDIGTFNDRFELIYTSQVLSVDDVSINENTIKVVNNETLNIISTSKYIKNVIVYDILGRTLQTYNSLNTKNLNLEGIEKANRMLLLKITLADNSVIYKKPIY